jgi:hypothetical protein
LPVTAACVSGSPGWNASYLSTIQAISRCPVPMSGAGTSTCGPRKSFLMSSAAKRRVIRSSSDVE